MDTVLLVNKDSFHSIQAVDIGQAFFDTENKEAGRQGIPICRLVCKDGHP